MPSVQDIPQPRSERTIVDEILDKFKRFAQDHYLWEADELHVTKEAEEALDRHYLKKLGRTAREHLPTWPGITRIVWDAPEFRVCASAAGPGQFAQDREAMRGRPR